MTVLITGSSGWLGRHLVPFIEKQGHQVIGLDIAPGEHTTIIASVADRQAVHAVFDDHPIARVIHAGALHKPDIARQSAQAFIDVNVTGRLNLLEASVRHGIDSFVLTSTTSLMISEAIREERSEHAVWLDESVGPLEPRNIYGVTKLAAENLLRMIQLRDGLPCIVLRTSRFFPEADDTIGEITGSNLKALELLYRRAAVEDMVAAHHLALMRAPALGFETFIVSAPTVFQRADVPDLRTDAANVIARYFPDAPELFAARGWKLPKTIGRVYDAHKAERMLGFRAAVDFGSVLEAMRSGAPLPALDDPTYKAPHAEMRIYSGLVPLPCDQQQSTNWQRSTSAGSAQANRPT